MRGVCAFFALLPFGAAAETVFEPPRGCEAVLTVQQRECRVENLWHCGGGETLRRWHGGFIDGGVIESFEVYGPDGETVSVQTFHGPGVFMDVIGATEETSISRLVKNGHSPADYTIRVRYPHIRPEFRTLGETRLTGNRIVLDGVSLAEIESQIALTATNVDRFGTELNGSIHSLSYLVVDEGHFVDGLNTTVKADQSTILRDNRPVEIIRPGEEGFFSRIPKYDCGEKTSSLELNIQRGSGRAPEGGERS